MPDVTIHQPSAGLEAYFTFKEPFNYYIKNRYNLSSLSIKLKVISIISMRDTIRSDLRDPFSEIYTPAGVDEVEFKKDLNDGIPIITFYYIDRNDIEQFIRVPLNYVDTISSISDIEYVNKLIVIDLNKLPIGLDLSVFFADLADFVETRVGVVPEVKEVSVGAVETVDSVEHETRETIRTNAVTVYKTLATQLAETTNSRDQILNRLAAMNIVLG